MLRRPSFFVVFFALSGLFADGIPAPDQITEKVSVTLGEVHISVPKLFASDEANQAYAEASHACNLALGTSHPCLRGA